MKLDKQTADRAKPIDAEFLLACGFVEEPDRGDPVIRWADAPEQDFEIFYDRGSGEMWLTNFTDSMSIHLPTRGQVLDFLAALKPGAE